jgi:hypothetical protein
MKIYALYRMYYGEDFIKPSIMSLLDHVDKIFIIVGERPFGNVTHFLDGTKIPYRMDSAEKIVYEISQDQVKFNGIDRIQIIQDNKFCGAPDNQFTQLYNIYIGPFHEDPDGVLLMETDMVWTPSNLQGFFYEFETSGHDSINSRQIEFWHNKDWRIPERRRWSAIMHKPMEGIIPITGKSGQADSTVTASRYPVHNFGFCIKPRNMLLKVELAKAYGQSVDAVPYENWYKEVWLDWHPETNNKNLEISKNYRNYIPYAEKCDIEVSPTLNNYLWNPSIFTPRPE